MKKKTGSAKHLWDLLDPPNPVLIGHWRHVGFLQQASNPGPPRTYHLAPMSSLLSRWVHREIDDVSKWREGPTEEGGCHVFSIHVESISLPRGPAFRE